jgi:3-deoxy-7-phosphoheptulonate synthase
MASAGLIAGADGTLVEIHEAPEKAMSDGAQTLSFQEAQELFRQLAALFETRQKLGL